MSSTVTIHFETEFTSHRFERGLALLLGLVALLYSVIYLRYIPSVKPDLPPTFNVSIKAPAPADKPRVEELPPLVQETPVESEPLENTSVEELPGKEVIVIQSQSQELKSNTTFNSSLLLDEILESREVPALEKNLDRSNSKIFDARFDEELNKSAIARAGRGNKKPAVEEYMSQFGEHTIRSGNLCAVNNTTMAGIMEIDSIYFVGECGTKRNAINFSYSPEKDGYLPP